MTVVQESLFVASGARGDELHLRRFRPDAARQAGGPPLLLLHGAVENGRIFYAAGGDKGLAPFLAAQGFDTFAADLRGRGQSRPRIARGAVHGQTDAIVDDLAALADTVAGATGSEAQHWLAHSWGGVLMASHLARFPARAPRVLSLTCFGTKRSITVGGREKLIGVDLFWNRLGPLMAAVYGYLPARRFGLGADDETRASLAHCVAWVDPRRPWKDPVDGFDYAAAAAATAWPRTLHLAGAADAYLGHPTDVRRFAAECRQSEDCVHLLARSTGHRHDYGHIDMLTHPDAERDHFPQVVRWLREGVRPTPP